MRFDDCLKFVLDQEGGYSNHPADRGGATNMGITQAVYDDWRTSRGNDARPVRDITHEEVSAIYLKMYWMEARCAVLPIPLDMCVFDAGVQHGPRRAVHFLQEIVGAKVDGQIGPESLDAIARTIAGIGLDGLVAAYNARRDQYYERIIANNPTQAVFARGWANRMAALRKVVGT